MINFLLLYDKDPNIRDLYVPEEQGGTQWTGVRRLFSKQAISCFFMQRVNSRIIRYVLRGFTFMTSSLTYSKWRINNRYSLWQSQRY